MSHTVLLIEDDEELGTQVVSHLTGAGLRANWYSDGRRLTDEDLRGVSLVILDLMLPGTYGLDILTDLRQHSEVPVLVLSARNDTADKVRALKLGADDYMTKPFWPEELVERVRARLRRPTLQQGQLVRVGPLHLDLSTHQAWLHDRSLELTPVEFAILSLLSRRPGAAVTRRYLVEHALDPGRDGGERTLDVHVSRLRKKLEGDSLIETVWGIGYRLRQDPER